MKTNRISNNFFHIDLFITQPKNQPNPTNTIQTFHNKTRPVDVYTETKGVKEKPLHWEKEGRKLKAIIRQMVYA